MGKLAHRFLVTSRGRRDRGFFGAWFAASHALHRIADGDPAVEVFAWVEGGPWVLVLGDDDWHAGIALTDEDVGEFLIARRARVLAERDAA